MLKCLPSIFQCFDHLVCLDVNVFVGLFLACFCLNQHSTHEYWKNIYFCEGIHATARFITALTKTHFTDILKQGWKGLYGSGV